jgi:hypothetical protein
VAVNRALHLIQHLAQGEVEPAVAFAGAIDDFAVEVRLNFGEGFLQEVDRGIEVIIVGLAGGDVELAA